MRNSVIAMLAAALLICLAPAASLALMPYSQDFEALNQADANALAGVGWVVYGNVFGYDWAWWYGYGTFPAPNGSGAFCNVAVGEGGASQGNQQMVVFSDYNNGNHPNAWIESLVFEEQTIGAGDVGETWVFEFDAKMGDLTGNSTAAAFIKTLNPAAGWATTNYLPVDMTTAAPFWSHYTVSIVIDASLVGQLLQFGFKNIATQYTPSGIFYDNVNFHISGTVPAENTSWGGLKKMFE